jgi:hypothetical protein
MGTQTVLEQTCYSILGVSKHLVSFKELASSLVDRV